MSNDQHPADAQLTEDVTGIPVAPVVEYVERDANVVQAVMQTADSGNGDNGQKPDREKHAVSRIVNGKNGGKLTPFTSERAREAVAKRWRKFWRAGARGMLAEVSAINPDVTNKYQAYGHIVGVQAGIAAAAPGTASEAIASTKAAEFVRKAIGADVGAPERRGAADAPAGGATLTLTLSGDVAAKLAQMLLERRSGGE